MIADETHISNVINQVFAIKAEEKRKEWIDKFLAEKIETIDDLKIVAESDEGIWKKLNLPSLVEGTLKKALKLDQMVILNDNNDSTK